MIHCIIGHSDKNVSANPVQVICASNLYKYVRIILSKLKLEGEDAGAGVTETRAVDVLAWLCTTILMLVRTYVQIT